MLIAAFVDLNGWSGAWVQWLQAALFDASLALVVAGLVWLAVRRNVAAAVGCLLFLLVLVKLVVPVEIPVPEQLARWSPSRLAAQWYTPSGPTVVTTPTDNRQSDAADAAVSTDVPKTHEPSGLPPSERDSEREIAPSVPAPGAPAPSRPGPIGPRPPRLPESTAVDMTAPAANDPAPVPVQSHSNNTLATGPTPTPAPPERAEPVVPTLTPKTSRSLPGLLMLAWLAVVLGLLVRSLWYHARFCRQVRQARPVAPNELGVDYHDLCARMRVRRPVRIVETDALSSPAVHGILRPVITLPQGLLGSISPEQMEWILLHELAHIRRHDLAVVWFQWLMSIVHFLNPAVWIANRMINRLREYACDDLALAHTKVSRLQSSEAFMRVVRHAAARPAAFNGAPGVFDESARASCFRRMARLLDTDRRLRVRLSVGSIAILVLAAALALPQLRSVGATGNRDGLANNPAEDVVPPEQQPEGLAAFRKGVAASFERLAPAASGFFASQRIHKDRRTGEAEIKRRYADAVEGFKEQVAQYWPYDDPKLKQQQEKSREALKEVYSLFSRAKGGEMPPIDRDEAVRRLRELANSMPNAPLGDIAHFRAAYLYNDVEPRRPDDFYAMMRKVVESKGPLNFHQISARRNLVSESSRTWRHEEALAQFYAYLRELNDPKILAERLLEPHPTESQESYVKRVTETFAGIEVSYPAGSTDMAMGPMPAAMDSETAQEQAAKDAPVAAHLTGTVVDREGKPVGGCPVQLFVVGVENDDWSSPVTTDDQGSFALPVTAEQLAAYCLGGAVRARSPDGTHVGATPLGPPVGSASLCEVIDDPITVTLKPLRTTTVRVKDAKGQPVAGAKVEALVGFAKRLPSFPAPDTDTSGATRLQIPEGIPIRDVIALKPGFGLDYFNNCRDQESVSLDFLRDDYRIAENLPDSIDLVLDGATTYRAQFRDSEDRPIENLRVSPWILQKPGYTNDLNTSYARSTVVATDSRGTATFSWIPQELARDRFELSIGLYQYPTRQRPSFSVRPPSKNNKAPDLNVELATPAAVSGKVTDPSGAPLANVLVSYASQRTLTGEDGTYRLRVPSATAPEATTNLMLTAEGWAIGSVNVATPDPGESIANGDCVLTRGTVVRARVVVDDGKTTFQQAMARIRDLGWNPSVGPFLMVSRTADEQGGAFFEVMRFDDTGICELRLTPGTYSFSTQVPYHSLDEKTKRQEVVVSGPANTSEPKVVEIRAETVPTRDYRFRVVRSDAPEKGVAGVTVDFSRDFTMGFQDWRKLRSGEGGRLLMRRSAGPVGYVARSDDGKWAGLGTIAEEDLTPVNGDESETATITLRPAASLRGRFVDRRGNPIEDGYVHLSPRQTNLGKPLAEFEVSRPPLEYVSEVRDGLFEFSGLPVGIRYQVSLIQAIEDCRPDGSCRYSQRTAGSEWVTLNKPGDVDVGDIECEYQPVEPAATAAQPASLTMDVIDAGGAEEAFERRRMRSTPQFQGTVTDPQGNPVPGCDVQLIGQIEMGPTGRMYRSEPVKTDSEGHYSIPIGPLADSTFYVALRARTGDGAMMGQVNPRTLQSTLSTPVPLLTEKEVDIPLAPIDEVVVHVKDGQGQPVAGADVEAYVAHRDRLPPFRAEATDAAGNTRVRYPRGARVYCILALKSGEGLDYFGNVAPGSRTSEPQGAMPERVELTLDGALTRRLQLVDTSARALQGLDVRPWHLTKAGRSASLVFFWTEIALATTDEAGVATIDWLPKDIGGRGSATVDFVPASSNYKLGYGFRVPCDPGDKERTELIELAPCATVSGEVTKPDGSPLENVRVVAETGDNQSAIAFTDRDGRYSLRLLPNTFEGAPPNAIAVPPSRMTVRVRNLLFHKEWIAAPQGPLSLAPGEVKRGVDFQVSHGVPVRVRLTIDGGETSYQELLDLLKKRKPPITRKPSLLLYHLAKDDAPKPTYQLGPVIPDDYLALESHDFQDEGQVVLRLPPGSYRLSPSVAGVTYDDISAGDCEAGLSSDRPQKEFEISDTDKELDVEFRVSTETTREYTLKAVRTGDPATPVAGVEIMVHPDSRNVVEPIRLTTDAEGEATIRRSTQPLTYLAYSKDRKLGASQEWLKLDPESNEVTIPMRPTRAATGRFLDRAGSPLAKCRVVCETTRTIPLQRDDGRNARLILSDDPTIETTTDAEGRFQVDGLIPGVGYEITAWRWLDEYERSMRVAQKRFDVPLDEPADNPIDCGDVRGRY